MFPAVDIHSIWQVYTVCMNYTYLELCTTGVYKTTQFRWYCPYITVDKYRRGMQFVSYNKIKERWKEMYCRDGMSKSYTNKGGYKSEAEYTKNYAV